MAAKMVTCKFCARKLRDEESYATHIENSHLEQIIEGMVPRQFVYFLRTGKTQGSCVMCKGPTTWNPNTNKYNRFCPNPECKEKYREIFKKRMIDKYGKTTLLNDPEQQKKMLAARKISGVYVWSDRIHKTEYTGSYEKSFLEFLDLILGFSPDDILAPSPHVYWYAYEGTKHFYIPDFYIPSLNLEIEIKDGGDNPNMHHKIQDVDKVKEKLKDDVMRSKNVPFNYLKVVNKNNIIFLRYLEIANEVSLSEEKIKIILEDGYEKKLLIHR